MLWDLCSCILQIVDNMLLCLFQNMLRHAWHLNCGSLVRIKDKGTLWFSYMISQEIGLQKNCKENYLMHPNTRVICVYACVGANSTFLNFHLSQIVIGIKNILTNMYFQTILWWNCAISVQAFSRSCSISCSSHIL